MTCLAARAAPASLTTWLVVCVASGLQINTDDKEVARLIQENQDLKRQLAGGGFK